jgi:hypothetical protein
MNQDRAANPCAAANRGGSADLRDEKSIRDAEKSKRENETMNALSQLCYPFNRARNAFPHSSRIRSGRSAAWLARLVRDQEVEGSNPFAPTILRKSSLVMSWARLHASPNPLEVFAWQNKF